jgi:hypothetical protein
MTFIVNEYMPPLCFCCGAGDGIQALHALPLGDISNPTPAYLERGISFSI